MRDISEVEEGRNTQKKDKFGFETLLLVRACPSVTYQHSIVSQQGCAQLQLGKNLRPPSAQLCLVPFQLLRVIVEILLPGNALFVRWFVRHAPRRYPIDQSAPVTMVNVIMVDVTVVDISMVEVTKVAVTFVLVTMVLSAKGKD